MEKSDTTSVTIFMSPDEYERLRNLSEAMGFADVADYLLSLVYDEDPIVGFREAWDDVKRGKILPLEALWQALEDEHEA